MGRGWSSRAEPSLSGGLERHLEALAGIEGVAQAADELSDALAVRAEVSERATDRPGGALQGHGDLAGRRGAADGTEPLDRCVAGPADHAGAGAGGEQVFVAIVSQQVDGLIDPVAEHAKAERDRPALAAARDEAPKGRGTIGRER